ncbi:serine/threonine protein kinase [Archangium gephyra]|uniref:serine/threonine-protein kinase n=1 Tax=Archangium gephyra TaxID=48 RepID=UPI0035D4CE37
MLSPGNVVERYEVERELGGGGMARVYKVRHVALGSVHALKVLDPELVGNAELRARFLDEGRIQARLRHPNILVITDVVVAPGVAGLVMDYLEGESLDKYLASARRPPDADEVRDIFQQVLAAMGFAHEHGVIHRDLKPSNIFLEQVHGRRVVRVLDFGIAKVSGAEGRPVTRTGSRMGTPQYMSPEQIRAAEDVTVRSDIFSLGITLYELATAQPCFQGESDFSIMEKIVRAEFVPPDVVHPGLEPGLRAAILRAMALEPERRFASCQEFSAALVEQAPARTATPLRVPVTRIPVTVAPAQPPEPPAVQKPEPRPEPVQAPAPRAVEARPAPAAPARLAEPKPSAPIEKKAPKLAKKPVPPSPEKAEEAEAAPPRGRPWRWALLFALAGLVALFGSGLIGMLFGGSAPKGGAPVTRPGGSPGTRSSAARDESLSIEVRPANLTTLELMDPQGRQFTVTGPYVDRKPTPGVWHVMGRAPGYEDERWTVEVTPGKPASLRVSLTHRGGRKSP